MASDRQIAANQRNALMSTGPRTEAGKAISRRNALTHGLRAEQLLLDGEDPVLFEMLREELFDEFAPTTAYEEQLTHQIVSLFWRLRRVAWFEAAVLNWIAYRQAEIHDKEKPVEPPSAVTVIYHGAHKGLAPTRDENAGQERAQLRLGRMLEAEMNKNLTAKLGRHEAHLMRQIKATRIELAEAQQARAAREADAVEVSSSETGEA